MDKSIARVLVQGGEIEQMLAFSRVVKPPVVGEAARSRGLGGYGRRHGRDVGSGSELD